MDSFAERFLHVSFQPKFDNYTIVTSMPDGFYIYPSVFWFDVVVNFSTNRRNSSFVRFDYRGLSLPFFFRAEVDVVVDLDFAIVESLSYLPSMMLGPFGSHFAEFFLLRH